MARYRTKQEMDALKDWIQSGYPIYSAEVLNHPIRILAQNCDYLHVKLQDLESLVSSQTLSESPTYDCPHFAVKDGMSYKEALIAIDRKVKEMYNEITHKMQVDLEVEVRSYRVVLEPTSLSCSSEAVLPRGLLISDYYYDGEYIRDLQNATKLSVTCYYPRSLLVVGSELMILWSSGAKSKVIDVSNNTVGDYTYKAETSGIFRHDNNWKFFAIYDTVIGGYLVLRYHVGNLSTLTIESSSTNTIFQCPEGYNFRASGTIRSYVAAYPYTQANSSNSSLLTYIILNDGANDHLYQVFISDVSNPGLGGSAEKIFSEDPNTGNNVEYSGLFRQITLNYYLRRFRRRYS